MTLENLVYQGMRRWYTRSRVGIAILFGCQVKRSRLIEDVVGVQFEKMTTGEARQARGYSYGG